MAENDIPQNSKFTRDVRAARNKEAKQTPQRKATTQIWNGNELPLWRALYDQSFKITLLVYRIAENPINISKCK